MTISFVPSAGDVLMCDFDGFKPPEMTKVRPVIILSPRSRRTFPDTYIVVPTSRTPPAAVEGWHCQLKRLECSKRFFMPSEWKRGKRWKSL